MKYIKTTLKVLLVFLLLIFVTGCPKDLPGLTEKEKEELQVIADFSNLDLITFSSSEDIDNVYSDIALVTSYKSYKIYWESSDENTINIVDDVGIIHRKYEDIQVTLKATIIVRDNLFSEREFKLTVKKETLRVYSRVTLDLDGGTFTNSETVYILEDGMSLYLEEEPIKEGYVFVRWTLNGEEYDLDEPVYGDIVLVAEYEKVIVKHTVTLNLNGGSFKEETSLTYEIIDGELFTKPVTNPTKEKHNFVDWYLGDTKYEFDTPVTDDIELVAHYEIIKHTVSLNLNGGSFEEETSLTYEIIDGELFTKPVTNPTKEKHNFVDWYLGDTKYEFDTPVTDDIELVAHYEIIKHTASLNLNGGSFEEETSLTYEIIDGELFTKPVTNPTKEKYNFVDWYLGDIKYEFDTPVTDDIELVAHYEIIKHTVTLNLNDGVFEEETSLTYEIIDGELFTKPATNPTKEKHNFVDWYLGDIKYDFNTPVTGDIEIIANYEIIKHIVALNLNDGVFEEETPLTYEVVDGELFTSPTKDPIKEGYDFIDWYFGDTKYNFNNPVISNIELVANYKKIKYIITLDLNGGTLPEGSLTTYEKEYGDVFSKPTIDPTKENYGFIGWNYNGKAYDFNNPVTSYLTLVAQYELTATTYTVTLNLDGGVLPESVPLSYVVIEGKKLQPITVNPTKQKHRFDSWYVGDVKFDFTTPIETDLTLKAVYVQQILVTIDLNGGTIEGVSELNYIDIGTVFPEINNPTKEGYEFLTWQINNVDYDFVTPLDVDTTLVATYRVDPNVIITIIKERLVVKYEGQYAPEEKLVLINQYDDYPEYQISWTTTPTDLIDSNDLIKSSYSGSATLNATITFNEDYSETIEISIDVSGAITPPEGLGNYYDEITASSGDLLVSQLQDLITGNLGATGSGNITYGEVRYLLEEADLKTSDSDKLWGIYNGASINNVWDSGATWDREHVWPQSRLNSSAKNSTRNIASDPHNLRACTPSVNSSRGNNYFVSGSGAVGYLTGGGYYPGDAHKGDVARILLFMAVRYRGYLTLVDVQSGDANTAGGANLATLSLLLNWHLEDLPDDFERHRNEVIYNKQGNRNPFIDVPNYFKPVWNVFMAEQNLLKIQTDKYLLTIKTYEILQTTYVDLDIRYTL
ncbi:MAG: InlB B-repeat-containing protein [Acholeplasmataceae bacterium]